MKSTFASFQQYPVEAKLFGGFDPMKRVLMLTVEAKSLEEAKNRMALVAPLTGLKKAEELIVLGLEEAALGVPTFLEGFFKACKFVTPEAGAIASSSVLQ